MPEECLEKSGFLFSHRCGHFVAHVCVQCQKPICEQHAVKDNSDPARILCVTCAKSTLQGQTRGTTRHDPYYDYPYFYTYYHYPTYRRYHDTSSSPQHDVHDFTDGDQGAILPDDGGGGGDFGDEGDFENDMGGS